VGTHWFSLVSPLDNFQATTDSTLCFDDLMLVHRLMRTADTRYTIHLHDRAGRAFGTSPAVPANATGRTCTGIQLAGDADGYTVIRISTVRPGFTGSTDVHVALEPTTRVPRVIGIWRP
jgi:hypothetical protein